MFTSQPASAKHVGDLAMCRLFCERGLARIGVEVDGSVFGVCTLTTVDPVCLAQMTEKCHQHTLMTRFLL